MGTSATARLVPNAIIFDTVAGFRQSFGYSAGGGLDAYGKYFDSFCGQLVLRYRALAILEGCDLQLVPHLDSGGGLPWFA